MSRRTPGLEETIRRRKRQMIPRAPEITLGKKVGELKEGDNNLQKLLEELVYLAERETIFTMTLDRGRLLTALNQAGYVVWAWLNAEHTMAPGATVTTYIPVVANFVYVYVGIYSWGSLPWWITSALWFDTDLPALPIVGFTRSPPDFHVDLEGIIPMFRFMRWTTTNNHPTDTAYFLCTNNFAVMSTTVWEMLEEVYVKPIVEYVREQAEKRTGRPFP